MFAALYPILDASFLPAEKNARLATLESLVNELLAAGVTLLQYRNKSGRYEEVLADALVLRKAAPVGRCLLIMNDLPALAIDAGFDGVHLGQQDMAPEKARALIGPGRILGISTHTPEQLASVERTSANYVAIGPVYETQSKQNPDPVVGIDGVWRARSLTTKPLVAIGGITVENCKTVIDAGADSVAVISSLFGNASARAPGKIASDFFSKLR